MQVQVLSSAPNENESLRYTKVLEFLLVLFGIGIIDSCLDGLYFYVPLLLIKIDYILLLLLFVIVVGLIPSISAIVKSITKKPIKVINSED